jgi:hypothetical protein
MKNRGSWENFILDGIFPRAKSHTSECDLKFTDTLSDLLVKTDIGPHGFIVLMIPWPPHRKSRKSTVTMIKVY